MSRGRRLRPRILPLTEGSWLPVAVSVVPGLGHLLLGKPRRGCAFFLAVALTLTVGLSHFLGSARILIGVAAGLHALSVFDLVPRSFRGEGATSAGILMVLNLTILIGIYNPLQMLLANALYSDTEYIVVDTSTGLSVLSALSFIVAFTVLGRFGGRVAGGS